MNKKIISVVLTLFCLLVSGKCFAFNNSVLDKDENINCPIQLNKNEIFFPGGWKQVNIDGKREIEIIPAKIYNVEQKKFINLNSEMNIPRNSYIAIKTNDQILIIGGYKYNYERAFNKAEIYNIKTNKFEVINDSLLPNVDAGITLKDGKIFIIKGCQAELYNPSLKTFTKVGNERKIINEFSIYNKKRILEETCCTNNIHAFGKSIIQLLDNGDVFIYSPASLNKNIAEIYNQNKNTFENIIIPNDLKLLLRPIKISTGSLLFFYGSRTGGYVTEYNPTTKTFKKIAEINLKASNATPIQLNENEILLVGGTIDKGLYSSQRLESAIYNIKTKKLSKVKVSISSGYEPFVFNIGNNKAIIFESNKKIKIYN